jgi:type IV secretory pathway VirB2 component (pilin)
MNVIPDLLDKLSKLVDKAVPGKKGRTALIAVLGIIYGIIGSITGNLDGQQATQVILGSFGLIFAANHSA